LVAKFFPALREGRYRRRRGGGLDQVVEQIRRGRAEIGASVLGLSS
jgi:hypothetical protein